MVHSLKNSFKTSLNFSTNKWPGKLNFETKLEVIKLNVALTEGQAGQTLAGWVLFKSSTCRSKYRNS